MFGVFCLCASPATTLQGKLCLDNDVYKKRFCFLFYFLLHLRKQTKIDVWVPVSIGLNIGSACGREDGVSMLRLWTTRLRTGNSLDIYDIYKSFLAKINDGLNFKTNDYEKDLLA